MPLESCDNVNVNDWLVCVTGPKVFYLDANGEEVETNDRSCEGILLQVIAISPPFILSIVYHEKRKPRTIPIKLGSAIHGSWSKATETYVKSYLKAGGYIKGRSIDGRKTLANRDTITAVDPDDNDGLSSKIQRIKSR